MASGSLGVRGQKRSLFSELGGYLQSQGTTLCFPEIQNPPLKGSHRMSQNRGDAYHSSSPSRPQPQSHQSGNPPHTGYFVDILSTVLAITACSPLRLALMVVLSSAWAPEERPLAEVQFSLSAAQWLLSLRALSPEEHTGTGYATLLLRFSLPPA